MDKIEKIKNKIQKNPLDIVTYALAVVGLIIYVILFCLWKKWNFTSEQIVPLTADWITILACTIAAIQLAAFLKDSRNKESRCRKEAALGLAEKYANDILSNITFIQNVLCKHYCSEDFRALEYMLTTVSINRFTKDTLPMTKEMGKYLETMTLLKNEISYDIIREETLIFDKFNLSDIEQIDEEKRKEICNRRFKSFVCDTLNTLEYFAMAVNQNVAESDMLFVSLHQTYIKFIYYMYPFICMYNETNETFYTNIIKLYRDWCKKKQNLENYKRKFEEEYNKSNPLTFC